MTKNLKIALSVLVLVLVVGGGYFLAVSNNSPKPDLIENQNNNENNQGNPALLATGGGEQAASPSLVDLLEVNPEKVAVIISFASDDFALYEADPTDASTALSVLETATDNLGLTLETKDYGEMGIMVDRIGDYKNGQDNKYWIYYANGKAGETAANTLQVVKGDKVEWRFEEPIY